MHAFGQHIPFSTKKSGGESTIGAGIRLLSGVPERYLHVRSQALCGDIAI